MGGAVTIACFNLDESRGCSVVGRMNTYVALLRGINVGGRNPLPMKELAALLQEEGATNVRTYLQSGNAVFQSAGRNTLRLCARLAAAIRKQHGFEPHILILGPEAIDSAISGNPFPEAKADPASLHLGFLAAKPHKPDIDQLNDLKAANERFHLDDRVFYLHAPDGTGRSKLAARAEKLLGVPMTDRNWRTVCKLKELAGSRMATRLNGDAQRIKSPAERMKSLRSG